MRKTSILIKLGRAIKRRRKQRNVSLNNVAYCAGLHPVSLLGLEQSGAWDVDVLSLCRLAEVLGTSPGRLLKAAEPAPFLVQVS